MIRVLLYLALLAVLVAGAVWLANDPGAVTLVWRGWRIDTSVGVLLAAIVLAVFVLGALFRGIAWLRGSVRAFTVRQREKRMQRGLVTLGDGFAAVHAGHGANARRLAREAGKLLGDTGPVQVLRKQAIALDRDMAELKAAAEVLLERPETEMAALKVLANRALADGDISNAITYARRAMTRGETPAWAVHLILDAEIAGQRWGDAIAMLDSVAGRDVFPPSDQARLRARLRIHLATAQLAQGQSALAAKTAQKSIDDGGGTAAIAAYARAMAAQGKGRKASSDIERAWTTSPESALLAAYRALVPGETALDWARRVETLVQNNSEHAESRLALAEAALGAELWGRARNRLQGLTTDLQSPAVRARAARLMAELENGERGDTGAVARWLREALQANQAAAIAAPPPASTAALLMEG